MGLEILGYLAAVCTAGANLPQVMKAWRSRSTSDLSIRTLTILATGLALWIAYGFGRSDVPLIAANGISLALTGTAVALKLRYG
ncbi:MAG: SemiSWEET transporter [Methylobacteriaceae bacterium]|nr:SemiSWEET transporter [Methylobacteriaceae bacterium]